MIYLLLSALVAHTYIPNGPLLFERLASNSGKRGYKIRQKVVFQAESENALSVEELWTVVADDQMMVQATASKGETQVFRFQALYNGNSKIFQNVETKTEGATQESSLRQILRPSEFYWHLFFPRSAKTIEKNLKSMGIIPEELPPVAENPTPTPEPSPLEDEEEIEEEEKFVYQTPSWIRFTRKKGIVNYLLQAPGGKTRIWVEQDRFVVSAFSLNETMDLERSKYESYRGGLRWPSASSIRLKNGSETLFADVHLMQVESFPISSTMVKKVKDRSQLAPVFIDPNLSAETVKALQQFYTRVR